jgi:hypothetical protein
MVEKRILPRIQELRNIHPERWHPYITFPIQIIGELDECLTALARGHGLDPKRLRRGVR